MPGTVLTVENYRGLISSDWEVAIQIWLRYLIHLYAYMFPSLHT